MRTVAVSSLILVAGLIARAEIVEVPAVFPTIQEAIEAVDSGDTILVVEGTYPENINFRGKDIVVASRFIEDGDVAHIPATIIDGSQPQSADSASCVMIIGGESAAAKLIGFTLTGGTGSKWWDPPTSDWYREGGGILVDESSPTIEFNMIIDNAAVSTSGGMQSAGGGGIRIGFGEPVIQNNIIINNRGRYGGGIVVNYADPVIRNNVIAGNLGGQDFGGAGVWIYGPSHTSTIDNNCIIANIASGSGSGTSGVGGGMMIWSTRADVRNNIIWANEAPGHPQVRRSGATGAVRYNLVEGGWSGEGNIDLEPDFVDFSTLLLNPESPCVDGGDSSMIYNDPEDSQSPGFAEYPSLGMIRNDMGIYGGLFRSLLPAFEIETLQSVSTDLPLVESFALNQNYPNPFNAGTTISFSLPRAQNIVLRIFDLQGRLVDQSAFGHFTAGSHEIAVDGSNLPSGIYFYAMRNGTIAESRKMVLIK